MGKLIIICAHKTHLGVTQGLILTSWKTFDWSGHMFGASANPRSFTKEEMVMSPSSTMFTAASTYLQKYVAFELLLHVAFVADEI